MALETYGHSRPITRKVIVKNMPEQWTTDYLVNLLEVETSLMISKVQTPWNGREEITVLVLDEPMTDEEIHKGSERLKISSQTLTLEPVQESPLDCCSLLVHYPDPAITRDHLMLCLDDIGEVLDCRMNALSCLAFVQFKSSDDAECVLKTPRLAVGGKTLKVEPWTEYIHSPLRGSPPHLETHPSMGHLETHPSMGHLETHPSIGHLETHPCMGHLETHPSVGHLETHPSMGHLETHPNMGQALSQSTTNSPTNISATEDNHGHKSPALDSEAAAKHSVPTRAFRSPISDDIGMSKHEGDIIQTDKERDHRLAAPSDKRRPAVQFLDVPPYKVRPLKELIRTSGLDSSASTTVTLLEKDAKVMFAARTDEECKVTRNTFRQLMQEIVQEEKIDLSKAGALFLKSKNGQPFHQDLITRYPDCNIDVEGECITYAGLLREDIEALKREVESRVVTKLIQVPMDVIIRPEFKDQAKALEQDYLVVCDVPTEFTTSRSGSAPVALAGLSEDVAKASRKMDEFASNNTSSDNVFIVEGKLKGKCVKLWFSKELDEAKRLISKNGDVINEREDKNGYCMKYRCRQEVLNDVTQKLDVIINSIIRPSWNLNSEFTDTTDFALVVKGLKDMGIRHFADRFQTQLGRAELQGLVDFILPEKCSIPKFELSDTLMEDNRTKMSASNDDFTDPGDTDDYPHGPSSRGKLRPFDRQHGDEDTSRHRGQGHRVYGSGERQNRRHQELPYSVTLGKTVITIKCGDITEEQVESAVSVVGQDLNMDRTALGKALLHKCPALEEELASSSKGVTEKDSGQLIVTRVPKGSKLAMSVILHAVLTRSDDRTVITETVKQLTGSCLRTMAKKGCKSISLPPLGVGKRFGYGRYTTASAMMSSVQEFLREKPNALKNITIVVGDDDTLGEKFVQALNQNLQPSQSAEYTAHSESGFGQLFTKWKRGFAKLVAGIQTKKQRSLTMEDERGKFEAIIYTSKSADVRALKNVLMKYLRKSFLHSETIDEKYCIHMVNESMDEVAKSAKEMNVAITRSKTGLSVRGQKKRVHQVVSLIRKETAERVDQRQKADQLARQALKLPTDTDHLPSYWTVRKQNPDVTYNEAIKSWRTRGVRLNKVTEQEASAVERLIMKTWRSEDVGRGADARGLSHSGIKVVEVKRLENPELWKEYSHRRDQLIDDLVHSHRGSGAARCVAVDKLPGSPDPVLTTKHIGKTDLLAREIFNTEINEHYLFHGTRNETTRKIYGQGLDCRLTSNAMLGKGVYFAECPTKSDQYADDKEQRTDPGENLTLLLVRVLLGHPFLQSAPPVQFRRPPCMGCKDQLCACRDSSHSRFFTSVVYNSARLFREFVVYEGHLCYPEYVITYQRV